MTENSVLFAAWLVIFMLVFSFTGGGAPSTVGPQFGGVGGLALRVVKALLEAMADSQADFTKFWGRFGRGWGAGIPTRGDGMPLYSPRKPSALIDLDSIWKGDSAFGPCETRWVCGGE